MTAANANSRGQSAQELHETLYDGVDLPVKFADGRAPVSVKVRKIPRREFANYSIAMATEESECAFYLGRDEQFAEALDDESFDAVMQEGRRLNFTRFAAWFQRQCQRLNLMGDPKVESTLSHLAEQLPEALKNLRGSTSS